MTKRRPWYRVLSFWLCFAVACIVFQLSSNRSRAFTAWWVRSDGSNSTNCNGTANAAYDGSGTGENCAFSNPQDALNAAALGDVINIRAGDTFTGNFLTPDKGAGSSFITVQTTGSVPSEGTRITPAFAAEMPKFKSNNTNPVLSASTGTPHHYKFIGIEFTNNSNSQTVVTEELISYPMVIDSFEWHRCWVHEERNDTSHPDSTTTTVIRGFNLAITNGVIKDSRIRGFRTYRPSSPFVEASNGILLSPGTNGLLIYNNLIESWFVPIFLQASASTPNIATISSPSFSTETFAGSATFSNVANLAVDDLIDFKTTNGRTPATNSAHPDETIAYQVARVTDITGNVVSFESWGAFDGNIAGGNPLLQTPDAPGDVRWNGYHCEDITIERNFIEMHFASTEAVWVGSGGSPTTEPRASQTNTGNTGKGYIEIKDGKDVLIKGNTFGGWASGFVFTSRNQANVTFAGAGSWNGLFNITVESNYFPRVTNWDRRYGFPFGGPQLSDNEYTSVRSGPINFTNNLILSGCENFFSSMGAADNVSFTHNTYPGCGDTPAGTSMIFAQGANSPNFVFQNNIVPNNEYGLNCQISPGTEATCWPFKTQSHSVIIDNRTTDTKIGDGSLAPRYPNDSIPANVAAIKFKSGRWDLASDSPYRAGGAMPASDGTDRGYHHGPFVTALGYDPYGSAVQVCKWSSSPSCN